jgi:hypothetical protein
VEVGGGAHGIKVYIRLKLRDGEEFANSCM